MSFKRDDSRIARVFSRYVRPEHLDRALTHWAKNLGQGIRDGRIPADKADELHATDAFHDAAARAIVADNPEIGHPAPEPATRSANARERAKAPWTY